MSKFQNIVCLHLNRFHTLDDIKKVLQHNDLTDLSPTDIQNIKNQGCVKIFIDKTTHHLVGHVNKSNRKEIHFSKEWTSYLNGMQSLDFPRPKQELSMDALLDKINEKGINSLSEWEKNFLKNQ